MISFSAFALVEVSLQRYIETIKLLLAVTLELVGMLEADHAYLEAEVRHIRGLPDEAVVIFEEIYASQLHGVAITAHVLIQVQSFCFLSRFFVDFFYDMRLTTYRRPINYTRNSKDLVLLLLRQVARSRLRQAVLYLVFVSRRLLGFVFVPLEYAVLYNDPMRLPRSEDIV